MDRLGHKYRMFLAVFFVFTLVQMGWSATGLQVKIESVSINAELKPVIVFTLQDDEGSPVAVGSEAGNSSARFMIAHLDVVDAAKGSSYYWSYNTRVASATEGSPNFGTSVEQATYDTFATERLTELAAGKYQYVFNTPLPADYDRTKTHTIAGQLSRSLDGVTYVANPLFHFVPNGDAVVTLRKVVTTDGCNKCHTNLGIHGGGRMEVGLCILCHSPQSTDPETGNTVDMSVMIHKIHMGAELPSVVAGTPYQIVGNRGSLADYSHVEFPTDHRNCAICHDGEQADVYKTAPSRRSCGSCHDDVNFDTGVGHSVGIPQADDSMCAVCHQAEGDEFGQSIAGSHTVPTKSKKLKGLVATILQVTNTAPGQNPVVRYTLTESDGTVVDPSTLRTLAVTVGGPNKEYAYYLREDGTQTSVKDGDAYTYTFTAPIPAEAQGTYSFSLEARRDVVLKDNPEGETDITATEAAANPMYLVAVTGNDVVQRRHIVSQEKCNACHDKVSLHGSLRNNVDYCVVCHNPKVSDISVRGEGVQGGESISFGYMIHKIHAGEELSQSYTVYGRGGTPHNYNEILFPGNRRDCAICHDPAMPTLPLSSDVAAINFTDKDGKNVLIPANTASCSSCHDSPEVADHMNQYNQGAEACFACHGAGQTADIAKYHKLERVLNVVETIGTPSTAVQDWYYLN